MNKPLKIAWIALALLTAGTLVSHAQTSDALKLKHRSAFAGGPARNPFWPIGWVKDSSGGSAESEETVAAITPDKFLVTSISTGANPLAVINGKTFGEGETINAMYGDQKIKILVLAIQDGEVVLQYAGKKYVIAMKAPEMTHTHVESEDALPKKDDSTIIFR
jgi:hypothetical protein